MENVYRNFYRNFYLRSGGFMPAKPLDQNIFPGDFFQLRNGEMIVLGNIFRSGIVGRQDAEFGYGIRLPSAGWSFSDGVTKPYSGRGTGQSAIEGEFEFSKQVLSFANKGSFMFKANKPELVKLLNWNDFQQQLIIKLTQTHYSFRELYVVTECATASSWALVISGAEKAELEIATDAENFGLVDIFGHHSVKTIQSKDIEYYHRETKRKPVFFKAKKLVIEEEKLAVFVTELIQQRENQDEWARRFFDYEFHYDPGETTWALENAQVGILNMMQANELNPNTALLYFRWADASLDDVEKLFLTYAA